MAPALRPVIVSHGTSLSMPLIPGFVHVALALEADRQTVEVDRDMLKLLGMSPAVAFDRALEWLRATAGPAEVKPVDTVPGMFYIDVNDGQAASRMAVLPELFDSAPLGGILAAVPSSEQLLCIPVHSVSAVDALRVMASAAGTAYEHATTPVCEQLFWHDGKAWSVVHVERVENGDITVMPPAPFFARMRQVAAMDLVRVAGEA